LGPFLPKLVAIQVFGLFLLRVAAIKYSVRAARVTSAAEIARAVVAAIASSIEDFVTCLTRIVIASSSDFAFPCFPCLLGQGVLR
jgi:hypothetical protein